MLAKIYGVLSFICLFMAPAAYEGDMYITSLVLIVFVWVFYKLAEKEAGRRRKKNRPRNAWRREVY